MTNLKEIEAKAVEFNHDLIKVNRELKRIASQKCLHKRHIGRMNKADYEKKLTEILRLEQLTKDAKALIEPKKKHVTKFEQTDVDILDYDETKKAIRSIQSKKSNTYWLTPEAGENEEYKEACRIEQMLQEHLKTVEPIKPEQVRKTEVAAIKEQIETNEDLTKEQLLELMNKLLNA